MSKTPHNIKCFMSHLGIYSMENLAFNQLKALVMSETVVIEANQGGLSTGEAETKQTPNGTLIVPISGMTMRNASSFGGTSTALTRKVIRSAINDPEVKGILLHIDSPGGHVDGTDALAQEIAKAGKVKPIHAHVEGQMASAAYWIGSQASKITADRMSTIGSLGTMLTVHDFSEKFEKEGIKTLSFTTGEYKGMGEPGTEITEQQQAFLQERVEEINGFFMDAVASGRDLSADATAKLFDGSFHLAEKALGLGLIDAIQGIEATLADLEATYPKDDGNGSAQASMRLRRHKS